MAIPALSPASTIFGTPGSDVFNRATDTAGLGFDMGQGGNDTVTGGSGNDLFLFGGAFTGSDRIAGGAGVDTLVLTGNYARQVSLGGSTVLGVENITFGAGFSYNLKLNKVTVAPGASLTVDASALASINTATVDAASATGRAAITFLGGAGADLFTGGSGTNTYVGGAGADVMGGSGTDIFVYQAASDSPLLAPGGKINIWAGDYLVTSHSPVIDLTALDLPGGVAMKNTTHTTANLDSATGFFGTASVVEQYSVMSSYIRAVSWNAFVDVNHNGNLDSGDMLIRGMSLGSGPKFSF